MGVAGCIQKTLDGTVLIEIEVQPGASRQGIIGYNEWRGRLQVAVMAEAQKGKANHAVCNVLSTQLGGEISVVSGHTSRMKKISIRQVDIEKIISKLEEFVESN
ncbi:MAG: DUF167 domain-containing protein [Candidatus Poseidoniaceae archaeon]|jgi:uncharacterized protein (TIGR00251 family)|nr:DUF167 domain-containing protein [Candidatus Poseidoniaceae archaeon]